MTMPVKNIIAAITLMIVGIGYGLLAFRLPDRASIGVPGPGFFPELVAGLMVLMSAALLVKGLTGLRQSNMATGQISFPGKPCGLIVWFGLLIYLLPFLGFLIVSIPFFAGIMLQSDPYRFRRFAAGAVLIPVVLYYLFRDGFHILLPSVPWM